MERKKTIELTMDDLRTIKNKRRVQEAADGKHGTGDGSPESIAVLESAVVSEAIVAPVTIKALDDSTAIWVNRELKGYGHWEGIA